MTITHIEEMMHMHKSGTCLTLYMTLMINSNVLMPLCYVAVREKSAKHTILASQMAFNLFFFPFYLGHHVKNFQ